MNASEVAARPPIATADAQPAISTIGRLGAASAKKSLVAGTSRTATYAAASTRHIVKTAAPRTRPDPSSARIRYQPITTITVVATVRDSTRERLNTSSAAR